MFCRTCEFDLRHRDDRRCPECGRAFDPDDDATFFRNPRATLDQEMRDIATGVLVPMAAVIAIALTAALVMIALYEIT